MIQQNCDELDVRSMQEKERGQGWCWASPDHQHQWKEMVNVGEEEVLTMKSSIL